MPEFFEIKSNINPYRVEIGAELLAAVVKEIKEPIFLVDGYFQERFCSTGYPTIGIEATEHAKSLDRIGDVIVALREAAATRSSTIVAVGGGVVQDVATFCASIYMRGVSWYYAPTTLLGMVDSCIGGKSSINVGKYKNIVGNFFPPKKVVIEPSFARSLTADQYVAGLCEAAKICYARGDDDFRNYLGARPMPAMEEEWLERVIGISLKAKKSFIESDEFDLGERQLLNFGHTFGHALEGASHFALSHGVAVGLGMLAAIEYSRISGRIKARPSSLMLLEEHVRQLLAYIPGLDGTVSAISIADLMDRFLADKKHTRSEFCVICPQMNGRLAKILVPKSAENRSDVEAAFRSIISGPVRTA